MVPVTEVPAVRVMPRVCPPGALDGGIIPIRSEWILLTSYTEPVPQLVGCVVTDVAA
ncbi:hypothetical protein GCM10022403_059010 [Streptomyces coacervatus]|uniref:Uncharacterized protein n=1 Tax=Streptomyces coacervatus TaxID=647381 RepID=A0ABP7IGB2_9ACTN